MACCGPHSTPLHGHPCAHTSVSRKHSVGTHASASASTQSGVHSPPESSSSHSACVRVWHKPAVHSTPKASAAVATGVQCIAIEWTAAWTAAWSTTDRCQKQGSKSRSRGFVTVADAVGAEAVIPTSLPDGNLCPHAGGDSIP